MDFTISYDHLPREEEQLVYRKVKGKTKRWVYPITGLSPASSIHCSAGQRENEPGYQGFRGYGGATLVFRLEGGGEERMNGPWHSSADALYEDTEIDLRNQYLTYVVIAKERKTDDQNRTILKEVVYQDEKPILGKFHRGNLLAMDLAKKLNCRLYVFRHSMGGSMCGPVYPDQENVYGKRKKPTRLSPEQANII